MAAPGAGSLAGRAVQIERDVPELAGRTHCAAVEPVVQDQAAADARAEGQHYHVPDAAPGAEPMLSDRCGVAVVLNQHRHTESPSEALAQVDAG